MNSIIGRLRRIFFEILPAFIFFLVMFHILSVSRALILKQYGIIVPASAMATIGALIMAKVVFLTDKIPFLNLYPRKPLLYNVAVKTAAFSFAAMVLFILEELLRFWIKSHDASAAWSHLYSGMNWPAFWLRQAWLFLLISFYCAAVELVRVLGADKVKSIFLNSNSQK